MKRLILITAVSLMAAAPVTAQAPSAPTVDQILARYVQALGGRAALERLTTRVMIGSFENIGGQTIPLEVYAKAPDVRVELLGFGEASRGYNGTAGWSLNVTENGLRELRGPALARVKRDAVFHSELELEERYALTVAAPERVGNREAYVIAATSPEGETDKLYFDAGTGLLIRRAVTEEVTPDGQSLIKVAVQIDLEDYREVDGIKLPFTIRRRFPRGGAITTTFREIKHNIPIEDAKFRMPRG